MLYFAWVNANELWNAAIHAREDAQLLRVDLQQQEGQAAELQVLIKNPGQGLLAPGRKTRAFLSYQAEGQTAVQLLFAGQVVGVAMLAGDRLATVTLTALPNQSVQLLQQLHNSLKVAPYWDDLFVIPSRREDPAQGLLAREAVYYWDKIQGTVALSGLFAGSQSLTLSGQFFQDSLTLAIGKPPLSAVKMTVVAEWVQRANGIANITKRVERAFPGQLVNSLSGEDLVARWPSASKLINGQSGYQVEEASLVEYTPPANSYPTVSVPVQVAVDEYPYPVGVSNPGGDSREVFVKRWWFKAKLALRWRYRQHRREELSFSLSHGVQGLVPSGGQVQAINVTLQEVLLDTVTALWQAGQSYSVDQKVRHGEFVYQCLLAHTADASFGNDQATNRWQQLAADGSALGAGWRASFFSTNRGRQAVHHAIERARVALAKSARVVRVTVKAAWSELQAVTLDHSVTISDARLPGGTVTGKVVALRFYSDGDSGERWAEVTIACAVGTGAAAGQPASGVGSYVADPYVDSGYQPNVGRQEVTVGGVVYDDFSDQITPNGLLYPTNLAAVDLVRKVTVINSPDDQNAYLLANQFPERRNLKALVNGKKTTVQLELMDLTADDQLRQVIAVTIPGGWASPRQIDLESA